MNTLSTLYNIDLNFLLTCAGAAGTIAIIILIITKREPMYLIFGAPFVALLLAFAL